MACIRTKRVQFFARAFSVAQTVALYAATLPILMAYPTQRGGVNNETRAAAASAAYDALFASTFDDLPEAGPSNVDLDIPGTNLIGRIYAPPNPNGSGIVLSHGCLGMWSDGQIGTVAQANIEKWGLHLAHLGYYALAIDSYTSRTPPGVSQQAFQVQCDGTTFAGAVDPYTTRAEDVAVGVAWLRYRLGISAASRVGLIGWSQGAEAVMVAIAETSRTEDTSAWTKPNGGMEAVGAAVTFYPGCGSKLGYVGSESLTSSFWRPHQDFRMNIGDEDSRFANCESRALSALNSYYSDFESGHWVDFNTYEGATHSFDGKTSDWPTAQCKASIDSADVCAADSADMDSLDFLELRVR